MSRWYLHTITENTKIVPMSLLPDNLSTVESFLENDAFRTWLLERRPEDKAYWEEWLAQHPEKRDIYEQAVATFLVIQGQTGDLSAQEIRDKTDKIVNSLPDTFTIVKPMFRRQWGQWAAAAAIAGLLFWLQFKQPAANQPGTKSEQIGQHTSSDEWEIIKNAAAQSLVVLLPDNSSVLLSTDSQLRFHKQMNGTLREVFLEGEAFFEVSKNPFKPFVVYTTNLTTRVLGTTFQIRAYNQENTAFVRVKTGKVTVTPITSPDKPILLTPNQKLSVKARREQSVKQEGLLSTAPAEAIIDEPFSFEHTPVNDAFNQLQEQYHMPIQYDRELLKNCTFTGKLDDVPFREKIRLICLTIESTYEITNNRVIIHSRGCN